MDKIIDKLKELLPSIAIGLASLIFVFGLHFSGQLDAFELKLIDLKFMMIKGVPPRDVVDFETLWLGDYQHSNIANDISMPAVDVLMNPSASQYKIKTRTTGHWFGGFQNCAEFCPKHHNLSINGTQQFEWLNWKTCANNPVISQVTPMIIILLLLSLQDLLPH